MLPLLRLAADGREHTQTEALDALTAEFGLTPEERQALLPSGTQPVFYNRIHWARSYLKNAGLFESTGRGRFRITALGQEVVAGNPDRVDDAFLRRFPAFLAFESGSRKPSRRARGGLGTRGAIPTEPAPTAPEPTTEPATPSPRPFPRRAELEAVVLAAIAAVPEGLGSADLLDAVPSYFPGLSPADLALRTNDGRDQKLRYEAMWARKYQERRGLLESPRWRFNVVTEAGAALVARYRRLDGSVDIAGLAAHFPAWPRRVGRPGPNDGVEPASSGEPSEPPAPPALEEMIEEQNRTVRQELHASLLAMPPSRFEALIGRLLRALGFEAVDVTGRSGDGGIDVRGTLVVGGVIRTRMAVQVKKWRGHNVQAPTVQQVRGSLGTHDQGLIITTSDFSAGARAEAERPNAVPVGLMNGERLVALLVEHEIGVRRQRLELIELNADEEADAALSQTERLPTAVEETQTAAGPRGP